MSTGMDVERTAPAAGSDGVQSASDDSFSRHTARVLNRHFWHPLRQTITEAYQKQYYPLGYSPALDGLRGLVTLGIFVTHVRYALIPGATLGMDVFFMMSGYFITSLLLRDLSEHGRIRYWQFYRRRFARILPAFLAMVAVYLLFRWMFFPPFRAALTDALIGVTYVANWWRAFDWPGLSYMNHTWSLAIEEQFYLIWPLTFALMFRLFGLSWRLVAAIAAVALAIWAWRIWLTASGAPFWRVYNGFDTRADSLMVGCALAVLLKLVPAGAWPRFEAVLPKLAWPFLISTALVLPFSVQFTNPWFYYVATMLFGALPGALLVMMLVRSSGTIMHRVLERPEPVFLGKIFYGMYLWHFPILFLMKDMTGAPNLVRFVVGLALTLLFATLSYAYIERHFMRVRARPPEIVGKPSASVSAPA
jgi:peptidoglycan/LPS O-acetylase OafA/YrhL